jgi:DUF1680 family protein
MGRTPRATSRQTINTMAIFSDSEFDNLALPIREKDLHKHPTVKHIFGSITISDIPIIKYVALLYDVKSPMRLKIPDVAMRKEECAEMAELKDNIESIFDLSHEKVLGYINAYLKYQSSKVWAVLAANEEVLWQYQQELLTPIVNYKNDKDKLQALDMKSKLMNECDAIIKRIDAYEEKLFGDNKQEKEKIINFTPETIANI